MNETYGLPDISVFEYEDASEPKTESGKEVRSIELDDLDESYNSEHDCYCNDQSAWEMIAEGIADQMEFIVFAVLFISVFLIGSLLH